jgi:hypothetical protein
MSTPPSLHAKSHYSKQGIKQRLSATIATFAPWLACLAVALIFGFTPTASAQTGSSISSTSGPVSWDFGPVVAGTCHQCRHSGHMSTRPVRQPRSDDHSSRSRRDFLPDQHRSTHAQIHMEQYGANRPGYFRHQSERG